jgi:class 3 adenylate cyclase
VQAAGAIVCSACGARLDGLCWQCGQELPPEARFCSSCGARRAVAAQGQPASQAHDDPAAAAQSSEQGERRQLTVMFCDLVDSTGLASRLDPEDLREVLHAYHLMGAEVVRDQGGHVAQYLGDGLLVFFGYPRAHEDDPVRAVRAGLAIVQGVPEVGKRLAAHVAGLADQVLAARIGVHTGQVVVGAHQIGASQEVLAWGDPVNLTARLQGVAEPGSVVISDATRRLVQGAFTLEPLGERQLKGLSELVAVFRVMGHTGGNRRPFSDPSAGATPLVDRTAATAAVRAAWDRACAGRAQAVLITGEAGIGKSRIAASLATGLAGDHRWLSAHCAPDHQSSALRPVIELLERTLGVGVDVDPAARAGRIASGITRAPEPLRSILNLLSIELSEDLSALPAASPEAERRLTLETLCDWMRALARERPTILVVEDLHWADPSTIEILRMLLERVTDVPLLLLLTQRSDSSVELPPAASIERLAVGPLDPDDSHELIRRVAQRPELPQLAIDQIVQRTEGVPLFLEEFTRTVIESEGAGSAAGGAPDPTARTQPDVSQAIPASLQDSLMARLDRLGNAKEVALLAAVLGREFPVELLAAISHLEPRELARGIDALLSAQILQRGASAGGTAYSFKHALIQQAAYQSLLKRRRQRLHADVVHALETRYPGLVDLNPEIIALHCERAALSRRAIDYWKRGAERARARCALRESIAHLSNAIRLLLESVEESGERNEEELDLRIALAEQLISVSGLVSADAEEVLARARELCSGAGSGIRLFFVLLGRAMLELGRANNQATMQLAHELRRVGQDVNDRQLASVIALPLGGALVMVGRLAEGRHELQGPIDLNADEEGLLGRRQLVGIRVTCQTWAAYADFLLGHPDRAERLVAQALASAEGPDNDPTSLAQALVGASAVAVFRREVATAEARARRLLEFSTEHQLAFGVAHGKIILGWVTGQATDVDAGIALLREGLDALDVIGTRMKLSFYLILLAQTYARGDRVVEGLATIDRALQHVERSDETLLLSEVHRLRAELLARVPATRGQAIACLEQAEQIAAAQGARLSRLRALVALTRLLGDDGARARLTALYETFAEGLGTADLRDARELVAARP